MGEDVLRTVKPGSMEIAADHSFPQVLASSIVRTVDVILASRGLTRTGRGAVDRLRQTGVQPMEVEEIHGHRGSQGRPSTGNAGG